MITKILGLILGCLLFIAVAVIIYKYRQNIEAERKKRASPDGKTSEELATDPAVNRPTHLVCPRCDSPVESTLRACPFCGEKIKRKA
nr:hypothetical protein [Candidatus Sigynarchaeota archaeon]